ncbi:ribonuclease H-like domain-containing protein [Tanacetum coccineum]
MNSTRQFYESEIANAVDFTVSKYGQLDIMYNNAGNSISCTKEKAPVLCHACQLGKHVRLPFLDVNNAFLHGDLSETFYMHQPLGFWGSAHPDYEADTACLLLYIDDIVLDDIVLDDIVLTAFSECKYDVEILERAHMVNCNPNRTPVDTKSKLGDDGDPQVCLYMHDSRNPYFLALKRTLWYVRGTFNHVLQLFSSSTTSLVAYSDADWAGCSTTRRLTSGYCVFFCSNLLSWSSKRQPTLSHSSVEVKYRSVANAVAETCWLENLLRELHTPLSSATLVNCDNVNAIYLSVNPVQHQRTKHIEIDIHFVRDLVAAAQYLSGSQLVVPVDGSLIELYGSKHVPTDERTIEALIARLSNIVDPELDEEASKTRLDSYLFDHIGPNLQLLMPLPELVSPLPELVSHPNTPGLTSGNDNEFMMAKQKKVKKQCRSKNLEAERNRRKRMRDNLLIIRSLVPKISKMDTVSIVGDTIKYIQELQENAKELEDELKAFEEKDCMVNGHQVEAKEEVDAKSLKDSLLSTSTTPIMDKIGKFENLIIDGQAIIVDETGNPLKEVEYPDDLDSEDEVASVGNDMTRFMASERVGFGTQSLLEQLRDSYGNGDYDEDPYDDDMYEGQDLPAEIQTICNNLDIRVRGRKK